MPTYKGTEEPLSIGPEELGGWARRCRVASEIVGKAWVKLAFIAIAQAAEWLIEEFERGSKEPGGESGPPQGA